MPNGNVLREHVEQMKDLLSEGFKDPNHEYEHVVTYTMLQWIRVIEFLQDMFKDNPYWSKILAKAHASILAVSDNLLQGKEIQDTPYKSFNRFSSYAIVMPIDHKMIPHSTLWLTNIRDDIKGLLLDYETHAQGQFLSHEGVGLLIWPTICGCKDLLPHIEDHLAHRPPGP